MANKRVKFARFACPTRKSDATFGSGADSDRVTKSKAIRNLSRRLLSAQGGVDAILSEFGFSADTSGA